MTIEARCQLLESEKDANIKKAEEWQEIATSCKRDNEQALKRATMEKLDLEAKIDTLEVTKQALHKETELRATRAATAKAELEGRIEEVQAEKETLKMKIAKDTGEVTRWKSDLEARIRELELEKVAKEREADEWQEVAMDTKNAADEARRKSAQTIRDLEAEIFSLTATKAAMLK